MQRVRGREGSGQEEATRGRQLNYTTEHQCAAKEGQGFHLFCRIQGLWLLVSHRLPAQDLRDRTQQTLEGLPVHREELGLRRGRVDAGRSRLVLDESELA